jgi:hypothetical protein
MQRPNRAHFKKMVDFDSQSVGLRRKNREVKLRALRGMVALLRALAALRPFHGNRMRAQGSALQI